MIDDRTYWVVCAAIGFRRGSLSLRGAREAGERLRAQMTLVGWTGEIIIYYRTGDVTGKIA